MKPTLLLARHARCARRRLRTRCRSLQGCRRLSVVREYESLVTQGTIVRDESQLHIAQQLDDLIQDLVKYKPTNCDEYDPYINELDYRNRQLLSKGRGEDYNLTDDELTQDAKLVTVDELFESSAQSTPHASANSTVTEVFTPAPTTDDVDVAEEEPKLDAMKQDDIPKGLYIYGTVGSGKSMLMNLFSQQVVKAFHHSNRQIASQSQASTAPKRVGIVRVHFQPFIDEVLSTVHTWRSTASLEELREAHHHNLLRAMAKSVAERAHVLCFDEMQMPDPASAVLVHSLFGYLFRYGAVLVATSNRPPEDLCMQGFRSVTAIQFIDMLQQKCTPSTLATESDYRLEAPSGYAENSYLHPSQDSEVARLFQQMWEDHCSSRASAAAPPSDGVASPILANQMESVTFTCFGRRISVQQHCGGAVLLQFGDVCGHFKGRLPKGERRLTTSPLGPHDFLEMARRFDTFFLAGVPSFSLGTRDEARRFIWLIDALYEHRCQLIVLAEVPVQELFVDNDASSTENSGMNDDIMLQESLGSLFERRMVVDDGQVDASKFQRTSHASQQLLDITKSHIFTGRDEVFSFARCQSRLREMQSHAYRSQSHLSERNRLDEGRILAMPSPPPAMEEDDAEEDAEEYITSGKSSANGTAAWAATRMAPRLKLRVEDIRQKAHELNAQQQLQQRQRGNSVLGRLREQWTQMWR